MNWDEFVKNTSKAEWISGKGVIPENMEKKMHESCMHLLQMSAIIPIMQGRSPEERGLVSLTPKDHEGNALGIVIALADTDGAHEIQQLVDRYMALRSEDTESDTESILDRAFSAFKEGRGREEQPKKSAFGDDWSPEVA